MKMSIMQMISKAGQTCTSCSTVYSQENVPPMLSCSNGTAEFSPPLAMGNKSFCINRNGHP